MAQFKIKARPWIPIETRVVLRPAAARLTNAAPLLARIVEALGTNATARPIGADRAQVSRLGAAKESIGHEMGAVLVTEGAAPVIRSIDGIAEGAFA
jgi:hypothetical protein